MGASPKTFTRLPATPVTSDLYDKLAAVQNNFTQAQATLTSAQNAQNASIATLESQVKALQSAPIGMTLTLAIRQVTANAFIQPSDFMVWALTPIGITITLPDAKTVSGQIFVVKNDAASGASVTMGSTNTQTIDGAAPAGTTLAANACQWFQSTGQNWISVAKF